jgi:DNA-binding NarL/FixJ family response regulator
MRPADQAANEPYLAAIRAHLSENEFENAWNATRDTPLEQVIVEARAHVSQMPPAAARHAAGLTAREVEVLQLLIEGLTDREIAASLSLSPRTVGGHVTHLLGKLGVDSRTAAVAYALRQGLITPVPPSGLPE